jgi:hypothetical protein
MVAPRDRVKILAKGPDIRKVSVIEHQGPRRFNYMPASAQGCWVSAEAVTR